MNSTIILGIFIIIAAIIIVLGYGYFNANPKLLETTSTSSSSTLTTTLLPLSPYVTASCSFNDYNGSITCKGHGGDVTTYWDVVLSYPGTGEKHFYDTLNQSFNNASFSKTIALSDIRVYGAVGQTPAPSYVIVLNVPVTEKTTNSTILDSKYCVARYQLDINISMNLLGINQTSC